MKSHLLFYTIPMLLTFNYTFCSEEANIFSTQEFDFASGIQDEAVKSDYSASEEDNIDQETKEEIDSSNKCDFERSNNGHFLSKKDKLTRLKSRKLNDLFKGCDTEMSNIIKFSECLDVLTWIDMSILLVYDIIGALSNNQDKYECGIYEFVYKVNLEFENFHKLISDVENLLIRYKTRLSSSRKIFFSRRLTQEKFDYIKNGLITSKTRMLALKEKFYRYKLFPIKDYHYATFIKIEKLNSLYNHLNKVRIEVSSLDEDEILLHHGLFKKKIIKPVSDIYEKLIDFRDRECGALPLFFVHDGLNEVLNDIKKSFNILQISKEDLEYIMK